eukprot:1195435-Prorocentrum_minimum.AAC.1
MFYGNFGIFTILDGTAAVYAHSRHAPSPTCGTRPLTTGAEEADARRVHPSAAHLRDGRRCGPRARHRCVGNNVSTSECKSNSKRLLRRRRCCELSS